MNQNQQLQNLANIAHQLADEDLAEVQLYADFLLARKKRANNAVQADRPTFSFLDIGNGKQLVLEQPNFTQEVKGDEFVCTVSYHYKIV